MAPRLTRLGLSRLRPPQALGAMAGQLSQALGSFVLQVLAARELGSQGFGVFAFMLGSIVMATALTTGLVGDSLTVLDRHDRMVRRALAVVALVVLGVAGMAAFVSAVTFGSQSWHVSLAFAGALCFFALEDLGRRLLMAELAFWRLVTVDAVALLASLATLALAGLTTGLSLDSFLLALLMGQVGGVVTTWLCLPSGIRRASRQARGEGVRLATEVGAVLRFGAWRAAQQFVRPTMLNLARFVVLVAASQAAVGRLEAARVFVAPAMLLVQGAGHYLFASYARGRDQATKVLLAQADRASSRLLVVSLAVGAATAAVVPVFGDLMTAGEFRLSVIAVLGWAVYAASCAAVMPYGSLATVRGRQAPFLLFRSLDSLASVALAAAGVTLLSLSVSWVPWLLSVGSFAGGVFCRQLLLRRLVRRESEKAMEVNGLSG